MRNEKGVSIIEVMIAMTILVIALLAMMSMFHVGIRQTSLSGNITTATQLANDKMEEIRNLPYESIDDSYYPPNKDNQNPDSVSDPDSNFPNYERYVTIQYVDSDISAISVSSAFNPESNVPPSNLLKVSVNVIWTTDTGARREHKEMTLIGG